MQLRNRVKTPIRAYALLCICFWNF